MIGRSLTLIEELGPHLGLHVNISKRELYCSGDTSSFPPALKVSHLPHFEILGCPIGDYILCKLYYLKRLDTRKLLLCLIEVAVIDLQVALTLLRLCGSFCRLSYLARSTSTDLVSDAFKLFDDDVHHRFMDCIGFATSDEAWCQAQLGLNSGGLGLCSLSLHSSSAFITSFCSSGVYDTDDIHLTKALDLFNSHVSPIEKLSVNSVVSSPVSQKLLSSKVNDFCLFDQSSTANKARLLSVSAPHATSWLSVNPSTSLALHLDPIEFRVADKWWLDIDTSQGSQCAFHPAHSLDPLGHHALTCNCGGEVISHQANDEKCLALRWVLTPLAVDSYGAWGREASNFLAQVIARLMIHNSLPKSQASFELFSNLSICFIRANARAILRRVKS